MAADGMGPGGVDVDLLFFYASLLWGVSCGGEGISPQDTSRICMLLATTRYGTMGECPHY